MGFIKAIKKFDTNFEVKLSTYAVPYMIGEIKRYIRDDGIIKVSRSIKELGAKITEIKKEYLRKKGIEITLEEISKELKISKEDVILAEEAAKKPKSIENDVYVNSKDGKTISILDKISNNKNEEEMIITKLTLKDLISNLNKREKEIILLRFYKDKTQTEVAKILGITQVQVSRLERKILDNMRAKMVL